MTQTESTRLTLAALAAQLGETEPEPTAQLKRACRILGPERMQELLIQTLQIERTGGIMLPDGSRRRTPGGDFFQVLRQNVGRKDFYRVVRPPHHGTGQQQARAARDGQHG